MQSKDLISLLVSLCAFGLSLYVALSTQQRSAQERQRTLRAQLTDVLSRLAALQLESVKLFHQAKEDQGYSTALSSVLGQEQGFLVDQSAYLAAQLPNLVTTFELNTIAAASAYAGNFFVAEQYYKNAINAATQELYRAMATRSYAVFLYQQDRTKEAREQFSKAVNELKGEDDFSRYQKGLTYQQWAQSELHFARSTEKAKDYFENARKEFGCIAIPQMREWAMRSVNAEPASPQAHRR